MSIPYAAIQHVVIVSKTFNALQVPRSELGISKNDKRHLLIVDADAAVRVADASGGPARVLPSRDEELTNQ